MASSAPPVAVTVPPEYYTASAANEGTLFQVVATSSPGDTLHTLSRADVVNIPGWADTGLDVVTVAAANNDTVTREVTVEWGEAGSAGQVTVSLPAKAGLIDILAEKRILRGLTITVWATATTVINVHFQRDPYLRPVAAP